MTVASPYQALPTEEQADRLPYPAFLLNDRRFIVYRNKASRLRSFHMRLRARIDVYVTKKAAERIAEMAVGEELFFDLTEENCYGAVIRRFETGYCVAIRTITAYMAKYVSDLALKLPSFFAETVDQRTENLCRSSCSPKELTEIRRRHNRVLRYQNAMAAYFSVTAGRLSRDSAVELSGCVHPILDCAVRFLRPNGIRLSVKETEGTLVARGNPGMIRFAVSAMLSVAAENSADGRVRAETRILDGEFAFHVLFEPAMEEKALEEFLSCYFGGKLLDSDYRDACFDLLLIQMISEKMGWTFGVSRTGCTDGLLALTLYIPEETGMIPTLQTFFDPLPLLETAFVRLMPETEG